MTTESRTYTTDIWKLQGTSKKTPVVAVTNSYTFSGNLNHANDERVLDVLNKGSVIDKETLPEDFVQLTNVEVISANGQKKNYSPSCLIAKPNILFVAENKVEQNHSNSIKTQHPLYIPKKSVCVEILMPDLAILARIHVCDWQRPMNVVNTTQSFLPLTMVEFSSRLSSGDVKFDFIAVNRNQILFMAEIEPQLNS